MHWSSLINSPDSVALWPANGRHRSYNQRLCRYVPAGIRQVVHALMILWQRLPAMTLWSRTILSVPVSSRHSISLPLPWNPKKMWVCINVKFVMFDVAQWWLTLRCSGLLRIFSVTSSFILFGRHHSAFISVIIPLLVSFFVSVVMVNC